MLARSTPLSAPQIEDYATDGLTISRIEDCARFALRIDPAGLPAAQTAFGSAIPDRIGAMAVSDTRRAICLGPDEWLLHAGPDESTDITRRFAELYESQAHSLVEISNREIGIALTGDKAALVLNSNCPRDLEKIPNRSAARTIFDTTPIVLIKNSDTDYRIELWNSFAGHVWDLLMSAGREIALGT